MKIYETVQRQAEAYADQPFLHIPRQATAAYAAGPVDYTYAEALRAVDRLRRRFADAGYGTGHRVAVALDNRADAIIAFLALNALGVSFVPLNMEQRPDELAHVIGHSDAVLVVSLPGHAPKLAQAVQLLPEDVPISVYDPPEFKPAPAPATRASLEDAAMVYTSGTTGKPKGCLLSEEYFLHAGEWYAELGGYCTLEPGRERLLTPLPLFHMNALVVSFMAVLVTGGCLIQLDRFHPSSWWATVRDSGATALHYLGVMPAILLSRPPDPGDDFSGQVKFGFGSNVEPEHHAVFEARFGFPLIEGWAMTETGCGGCIMANTEPRHVGQRCFGRPSDAVELRLADDAGQNVAAGEPGELLIRAAGPDPRRGFFSGYYKDPAATAEAWQEGWLHTGDVARADRDGSLFFVERKKNIIRRSGENIAISEVEATMMQHESVDACAVAPVRDMIRGEEVFACVVLHVAHPATAATARDIFDFCHRRLTYYKAPGYIAFVDEIPTTATQKIRRADMKKLAAGLAEHEDTFDLREFKRRS